MDPVKLQAIADKNADNIQGVYGVFDPDRIPELEFKTFDNVKHISAAVSPDCSFRLVRDAIDAAEETIDLYIYNLSAEYLLDLLRSAKDRGVAIRLMYDVMDTRGNERQKIQQLGVERKEAPSSGGRKVFTVCHQKFAVIDGHSLLLGSANWAGTSIPKVTIPNKFKKGNREWLIHIVDEALAGWYAELFQADWDIEELQGPQGAGTALLEPQPPPVETRAAAVELPDEVFDIETPNLGQGVAVTPILSPDNYFKLVRDLIRNATTSIDIEQQYIQAGGPKTKALLEELSARKNDVTIRILVSPAFKESWDSTVETLTAAGLDDRLRAINLNTFTHLHNKGVLVDARFTVVTSTNMSENSITQAREAGVLIDSEKIGGYFKRVVDVDWSGGLDPADVPSQLAALRDTLTLVEEPTVEIHPADLRMI
jgi:cardiolipin synthase